MPSINRPNAPDRLPSADFGSLFFRSRALRSTENSSNTTPSPLTSPKNNASAQRRANRHSESSSPLASPSYIVSPRPLHIVRRSYRSEANGPSSLSNGPEIFEEAQPAQLNRTTSSDSSTVSARARRLLSSGRRTPKEEQPSREARRGFKWTRAFSGRWFEIRIGPKQESTEALKSVSGKTSDDPIPFPLGHASTVSDRRRNERWSSAASDERLLSSETPDSSMEYKMTKEGLYCRTKRALGLKREHIDPTDTHSRDRTPTDNLLDRVSSTLKGTPERIFTSSSSATSVSNLSIAAPRWQRVLAGSRKAAAYSSSSSVRDMLLANPPLTTPEPEAMYTGSDAQRYISVNLTEEGAPAFLPSEARRINTPPLPTGTPGQSRMPGFFFDYVAPSGTGPTVSTSGFEVRHPGTGVHEGWRPGDWYRVKHEATEAETGSREQFVAAVPDHLPNSPLVRTSPSFVAQTSGGLCMERWFEETRYSVLLSLTTFHLTFRLPENAVLISRCTQCPRHPKHKSRGTGECHLHGRNEVPSRKGDEPDSVPPTPKMSPPDNWWYS